MRGKINKIGLRKLSVMPIRGYKYVKQISVCAFIVCISVSMAFTFIFLTVNIFFSESVIFNLVYGVRDISYALQYSGCIA